MLQASLEKGSYGAGFRDSIELLEEDARSGPPLAVMCAETVWWRCHRRMIADALTLRGFPVVHLIEGCPEPHRLSEHATADADGWVLYREPSLFEPEA